MWRATSTTQVASLVAGMIVAPATVTVAEIPDPLGEPHADWMYYRAGGIGLLTQTPSVFHWEFDLGGQRKQRELERDWNLVLNNVGPAACDFLIGGRSLLLLA